MTFRFKQSASLLASASALVAGVLASSGSAAQQANPSGFGLQPSVELNLSVLRGLADGSAMPPASVQPPAFSSAPAALPAPAFPAAQPAFSEAPRLDPGLVQPPRPVTVVAPPPVPVETRKLPVEQPYVPPAALPVYVSPQFQLPSASLASAPPPVQASVPVAVAPVTSPAPVSPMPVSQVANAPQPQTHIAPTQPVFQPAPLPQFSTSPQHGFVPQSQPIPIRVTHLVPFQTGESQAHKLSGVSSKNTAGTVTQAAEDRWARLSTSEKAASPEFQVAASKLRIRPVGVVATQAEVMQEPNQNIRERDRLALANEAPQKSVPPKKPAPKKIAKVVQEKKPKPPKPAKKVVKKTNTNKQSPAPKKLAEKPVANSTSSLALAAPVKAKPTVAKATPPIVKPKEVKAVNAAPAPAPKKKKELSLFAKPKPAKKVEKVPEVSLNPAPPKIPPLAAVSVKNIPKVPPPPDLSGIDFSDLKSTPDPNADELSGVTPDKLLTPDTLVVKRDEAALLPEISVPQKAVSKTGATNPLSLPVLPAEETSKQEDEGLIASLSDRISNLVTKDPETQGVIRDETRVVNPLALQQEKQAKESSPELPALLPPPGPALAPPVVLPHEGAAKPAPVNLQRPQVIAEKPDLTTSKVAALPNLPSLDALTDGRVAAGNVSEPSALPDLPEFSVPKGPVVTRGEGAKADKADNIAAAAVSAPAPKLPEIDLAADSDVASVPSLPPLPEPVIEEEPVQLAALPPAIIANQAPPPAVNQVVAKPKASESKASESTNRASADSANAKPHASVLFSRDATELNSDAKSKLLDLASEVKRSNQSVRIVAYAEGNRDQSSLARRLSLSRALQVRAFLIDKGVNQLKINVQARGNQLVTGTPNRADIFLR